MLNWLLEDNYVNLYFFYNFNNILFHTKMNCDDRMQRKRKSLNYERKMRLLTEVRKRKLQLICGVD